MRKPKNENFRFLSFPNSWKLTFFNKNQKTGNFAACLADDGSVIQLGRTFVRSGMKHFCSIQGDNVTYKQESMCYENGMHYNVGDSFRNGSFKLTCREQGIYVEGMRFFLIFDLFFRTGSLSILKINYFEIS